MDEQKTEALVFQIKTAQALIRKALGRDLTPEEQKLIELDELDDTFDPDTNDHTS